MAEEKNSAGFVDRDKPNTSNFNDLGEAGSYWTANSMYAKIMAQAKAKKEEEAKEENA